MIGIVYAVLAKLFLAYTTSFIQGQEIAMQAIEFKSQLEHGQIAVPAAFHLMEGQPVRVLILLDETSAVEEAKRYPSENIWEKTAGAWQGGFLVRDLQGEYEQRLELE